MSDNDSRFTDADLVTLEPEQNGAASPANVLDALRERRAAHAVEHSYDVEVPGYDGLLVLRCGPIGGSVLTKLRERIERSRSPERDFNLNADTLIAACRSIHGRAQREAMLTQLVDAEGEPVGIDERLATLLGFEAKSARDVLRGVFAGANSPELAIAAESGRYVEWAQGANAELDEELLGES